MKVGKTSSLDQKSTNPNLERTQKWNSHQITLLKACGLAGIISSIALGSLTHTLIGD